MSSNTLPDVALFGATGGTGLTTLKLLLDAGHDVSVLARSPDKLSDLAAQYPCTLHIIKGDVSDVAAVKSCLVINNRIVDFAVSAVGMTLFRKGMAFTGENPKICEEATYTILNTLNILEQDDSLGKVTGGTKIIVLSTTGISDKGRDIPIAMIPLYHWMLPVPHKDKKAMEVLLEKSGRRYVAVRPSFLQDGEPKGLGKIRTSIENGTDDAKDGKVAIGYFIRRADVALWIYEECIKGSSEKWSMFEGKNVTLTY